MTSANVFVYGSLMFEPVLHALIGRTPRQQHAALPGYRRLGIRDQVFPGIMPSIDEEVRGLVLFDLLPEELAVFDEFEGDEYIKTPATPLLLASSGDGDEARAASETVEASVYVWRTDLRPLLFGTWDPDEFERSKLPEYVEMCRCFAKDLKELWAAES
jgi:gamma-glutamylcyclotransferase (GGCT)/AIG2-like uncharacterized protein YtfP